MSVNPAYGTVLWRLPADTHNALSDPPKFRLVWKGLVGIYQMATTPLVRHGDDSVFTTALHLLNCGLIQPRALFTAYGPDSI